MQTEASLIEHGLAMLQSFPLPIIIFLAPLLYYLRFVRKFKSSAPKSAVNDSGVITPDCGEFDMSNVRITKILVHPIKSCKGTSVREAKYTAEGLENDRKWCIIRADNNAVLTAREAGTTVLIHPRIVSDLSPEGGRLEVTLPKTSGCEAFSVPLNPSEATLQSWKTLDVSLWGKSDIEAFICESIDSQSRSPSAILSEFLGLSVHLVMKGPRPRICPPTLRFPKLEAPSYFQDGYPLLVVSEESVAALQDRIRGMVGVQGVDEKWSSDKLLIERFRPNIVFKGAGAPFAEDVLTEFAIDSHRPGDAIDSTAPIIHLVSKCTRCLLPNVDTETGIRDKAVPYKVMMKFRRGLDPENMSKPCMGCNGAVTGDGVVKVGDWVHALKFGLV
ncbi:hypothetical protein BJ138DRAFT_1075230 [Hygrophoropsis aurantiaca]|uniref:Uncharacterized protein n=1 Tax=Hygrophoropsis aurantiaca TaxID=72124 RepID=A0ACB8AT11_9AGAM|nr:hypothetical protein BJ138DRAFT_1075230 [Hygrophoropsis aurantiaca]